MMENKCLLAPLALAVALALPTAAQAQEAAASAPPLLSALEGAQITVRMSGHVDDEFSREVERDWLPVVREAAGQFDRLVRETMRARLHQPVPIYVAAGRADYEALLSKTMNVSPAMAARTAHVTGGLANAAGKIAIVFTPGAGRAAHVQRAVKTSLHELTHQLQRQLAFNYYGFEPPRWMTEGSADLVAHLLAERVEIEGKKARSFDAWRALNLAWWQRDNRSGLTPELLMDKPDGRDWLAMSSARRGNYQLAGLMVAHLRDMLGDEAFFRAWVRYYISAGDTQLNDRPDKGFERAFGLTEKAFLADFRRWLDAQPVTTPPPAQPEPTNTGALP